jgi:hypothetical protein
MRRPAREIRIPRESNLTYDVLSEIALARIRGNGFEQVQATRYWIHGTQSEYCR